MISFIYTKISGGDLVAKYELAYGTVCGECGKDFINPFYVYNVTNTDYKSSITDKLMLNELNKVTCPKCKSTFTYERPFLAYSLKKGYAVFGVCKQDVRSLLSGKQRLFEMMNIKNMKFRLADYLCEVAEKVCIFENGLDDISIEIVKNRHFSEKYFENNSDYYLMFKCIKDDNMIFEYINSTDDVLETHEIPMSEYPTPSEDYEPESIKDGYILWTKTDNKYIKEICHE